MGAVEPQRGCDGITALYLPDRSTCIAASLELDSSHIVLSDQSSRFTTNVKMS